MRHGSLFSGIGGFDLAAEWMGWDNKFHCEINEFGQKVLNYYWPEAKSYDDITKTDFSIWRGRIDILTGGFPCQPYSMAGKRLGTEDERHLWPEMLRVIREVAPTWIVGENVLGLVNWNDGLVFEEVQTDLEAEGYEVQPYVLPAAGVNAPHRRDRVWFVGHKDSTNPMLGRHNDINCTKTRQQYDGRGDARSEPASFSNSWNAPDTDCLRHRRWSSESRADFSQERAMDFDTERNRDRVRGEAERCGGATPDTISTGCEREREQSKPTAQSKRIIDSCCRWERFPTQSAIRSRNDGVPTELVGITIPKHRNESIKAYGNAIVPHVVYQIFNAIQQYEDMK